MKDEIRRINKLVAEGKISPDDAADLIDAFYASEREDRGEEAGPTTPPSEGSSGRDPFRSIVDQIEKLTKEGADAVDWKEFQKQAKEGALKGLEFLKSGIDDLSKGRVTFFGSHEIREVVLPLAVPEGKLLKIESNSGDIQILGGQAEGSATAKARFRGTNSEEAKKKASEYTLIIEESENQVLIRQPDVTGIEVDLVLKVVGTVGVEVRSEAGDISVNGVRGCRVHARLGDVSLKDLQGQVDVESESGDISVAAVESGNVTIASKSGDVSLTGVKGTLKVRSSSGDVTLKECAAGTLSLEAASGDISVDLIEPVTGTVSISSVRGDASVAIPDGSDCRVSLSTLRGAMHCNVQLEDEAVTEKRVTGKLGAGSGTLDVSAVAGDVHLDLRAHKTANV